MDLTESERAAIRALEAQPRTLARGATLRRERDAGGLVWALLDGWVTSAIHLHDGGRQITRIHLRGDLVGTPSLAIAGPAEVLTALTEVTVSASPRAAVGALFVSHPRIGALLFLLAQLDTLSLCDGLAAIGRTDARARLAALLLSLHDRLSETAEPGQTIDAIPLPMTQEELGDATGLTAVHVNRMMRALAEEGLIGRTPRGLRLLNRERLTRLSGYMHRPATVDTSWLPPASEV